MTSSSKLILSATLLAVGYGVASFLGSPHAPYLSPATRASLQAHAEQQAQAQTPAVANSETFVGGARLYPEIASSGSPSHFLADDPRQLGGDDASLLPTITASAGRNLPRREAALPSPIPVSMEAEPLTPADPYFGADSYDKHQTPFAGAAPSAEQHDATIARSVPTVGKREFGGGRLIDAHWLNPASNSFDNEPGVVTIGSIPVLAPKAAATASFEAPGVSPMSTTPNTRQIADTNLSVLPPVSQTYETSMAPSAVEPDELRRHRVVDGDSLERLAERYLRDPGRSGEIFELNRDVLQQAELLPIGVELKIPPRATHVPPAVPLVSSGMNSSTAAPEAVPMRPVPAEISNVPRAQLLHPLPAGWPHEQRN